MRFQNRKMRQPRCLRGILCARHCSPSWPMHSTYAFGSWAIRKTSIARLRSSIPLPHYPNYRDVIPRTGQHGGVLGRRRGTSANIFNSMPSPTRARSIDVEETVSIRERSRAVETLFFFDNLGLAGCERPNEATSLTQSTCRPRLKNTNYPTIRNPKRGSRARFARAHSRSVPQAEINA